MPTYLIEVRDSDGNDCTVYDALVTAPTRDAASAKLWARLEEWYPTDEGDGGFGTYHTCDCRCEHSTRDEALCDGCAQTWECSHGGLTTNEDGGDVEEYATVAAARQAHASYHSLIDLTED